MLKPEEKYILRLLRTALKKEDVLDDHQIVDIRSVMEMLRRNDVLSMVYPELPESIRKQYEKQFMDSIMHSVNQDYEGNIILKELSNKDFDCIALKGWELRNLYPQRYMRHMADIDILIRPYKFVKIKEVMTSIGYHSEGKSSWKHDNFTKASITVEMHKRLTDDSDIIMNWEQEIWSRAIPTEQEHIFRMSSEDFYLFHFVHLYKDFMNGSLGLRRIADTWLLRQLDYIELDYIEKHLECFGMRNFHQRMIELSEAIFGKREFVQDDEILLRHSLLHGIYGSQTSYKAGRIVGMSKGTMQSGKLRSMISSIFLPVSRMKAQFPILQKWPLLLPVCWAKRIWELLNVGDIKGLINRLNYNDIGTADYEGMKEFFKAGGVF